MFSCCTFLVLLLAVGIRGGVIQGEQDGTSNFAFTDAKKMMLLENRFPKNYPLVKEPGIMVQMVPNLPGDLFNFETSNDGKLCEECKSVLSELAEALQDEKIVAQYKRAFKLFCMLTIRRAADCEAFAETFDMLIDNLKEALNDPGKVCKEIHFCSQNQPDLVSRLLFFVLKTSNFEIKLMQKRVKSVDVICDECLFMVNEMTTILSDPAYQKEIQGAIKNLCRIIPQVKGECENAVDSYAPAIFENMLDYLANPRPFCQKVGMCKGALASYVPMTDLLPAKGYSVETNERKNVTTSVCPLENLKTSNGLPAGCIFCNYGLAAIMDLLKMDSSMAAMEDAVLSICNIFPADWSSQCTDFVLMYFKSTMETFLADFNPKMICESLKVCKLSDKLRFFAMSSDERKATTCEACKLIVEFSRKKLSSPTYQFEIIEQLANVCQILPMDKAKQCLLYVDKFVVKLMSTAVDNLADQSFCAKIGQCDYQIVEPSSLEFLGLGRIPFSAIVFMANVGESVNGDAPMNDSSRTNQTADSAQTLGDSEIKSVCLVGTTRWIKSLPEVLKNHVGLPVYESANGVDHIQEKDMAFILNDFSGPDFSYLYHAGRRIYGPTAVFESAMAKCPLPLKSRPLYCDAMKGITICFAGFFEKKTLMRYVDLVHYMGGSVRRSITLSVTHIVASTTQSAKYRLAVGLGKRAMHEDWILKTWEKRHVPMTSALSPELLKLTLAPFHGLKLYFHGFSSSEEVHMSELARQNGASVCDAISCTHFVTDPSVKAQDLSDFNDRLTCHFVTAEWFWVSIQLDLCANEDMYTLTKSKAKKRQEGNQPQLSSSKRQVSGKAVYSAGNRSEDYGQGNASLELSSEMSSTLDPIFSSEDLESAAYSPRRGMSKRQQVAVELMQTECKYVEVLNTIITLYKEPLENPSANAGDLLLDAAEMKIIFGNLPLIRDVHSKLYRDLANLIYHWSECRRIGRVWLNHADELVKVYPPFVNFYERTKEMLNFCDRTKPRFHAFLKARQNRPESNRESLQELIIRPVQRLPSVILLLSELLKNTDKSNADHADIQKAIEALKRVLTFINEDKRRTEGQVKLFDIVNQIENCPPHILSSHRQFIAHVDATALSNGPLTKKGMECTFYLFNDCLEITKRRMKPGSTETRRRSIAVKQQKHVDLLFMSSIRRVVDVNLPKMANLFCLTIRNSMGDTNYTFEMRQSILAEAKVSFLESICKQVLKTACRAEFNLQRLDNVESCDDSELASSINKAAKYSSANGHRLRQVLSFNKKGDGLRRAVSQMALNMSNHLRRMSRSNLRLPLRGIAEENDSASMHSVDRLR
uniref:Protein ECT2 n=1 Tax=Trichuris muris TaxID=70415 RepID=A0A5S6R1H6_TRIMR